MNAADIMTTDVVTVNLEASVRSRRTDERAAAARDLIEAGLN